MARYPFHHQSGAQVVTLLRQYVHNNRCRLGRAIPQVADPLNCRLVVQKDVNMTEWTLVFSTIPEGHLCRVIHPLELYVMDSNFSAYGDRLDLPFTFHGSWDRS